MRGLPVVRKNLVRGQDERRPAMFREIEQIVKRRERLAKRLGNGIRLNQQDHRPVGLLVQQEQVEGLSRGVEPRQPQCLRLRPPDGAFQRQERRVARSHIEEISEANLHFSALVVRRTREKGRDSCFVTRDS